VRLDEILRLAEGRGIPVRFKKGLDLDRVLPGIAHQGIVALSGEFAYSELEDILGISLGGPEHALVLAADHITDEGNLGALIRTAAFFGAHGLILPRDRSASVTERVVKRSSGALVHLPVARVVNLARTLDISREKGFWIIGAAGESDESIYDFDWQRDLILILGSEGRGLGHTIRGRCHQLLSIPRTGSVESLNVSVAAGVILSEIIRQRGKGGGKGS